jgi:hypothetical protein
MSDLWSSPLCPLEMLAPALHQGGRRFPDAWAGPEVDSVGKNVLEDLEQIDKSNSK